VFEGAGNAELHREIWVVKGSVGQNAAQLLDALAGERCSGALLQADVSSDGDGRENGFGDIERQ